MHLDILAESEAIENSPDSLKFDARFEITTTQNIKSVYSKDVAREYIKTLDIEEVKELASDSSPVVVDLYECVENNNMEDFLPLVRRFYYYLKSDAIGSSSKKYRYFDELLSLGDRYNTILENLKAFLSSVSSEDDIILKKIGAIYDKFSRSSNKTFKELFRLYGEYTRNENKETRNQILKIYWNNKSNIDDIVDEMYSISGKIFKNLTTPITQNEQEVRNKKILEYFEENNSDLKWFSEKLLYIEYLKEFLEINGQHTNIDFNKIKEFCEANKKTTPENVIKNIVKDHFEHNSEITKTSNKLKISVNSAKYEDIIAFIEDLYDNGNFTIDCELSVKNPAGKFGNPYKILYSMYSTKGVNHLFKIINDLRNIHGSNKVLTEMENVSEDSGKIYKKIGFIVENNVMKFNGFVHNAKSFIDQFGNKVKVLESAYNLDEEKYNSFITETLEKMNKKENPHLSLKDSLRDLAGDDLNQYSYKMLINEIRDENSKYVSFIINRICNKVYSLAMSGKDLEKYLKSLFIEAIKKDQDEVVGSFKFKQAVNVNQAKNMIELLSDFSELFSKENQAHFIDSVTVVLSKFLNEPAYYKNSQEYVEKLRKIVELLEPYSKKDKLLIDVKKEIDE